MKLLLAEDTRDLNRSVTVLFEMQGYEVDSAFDGEQALDFLKNDSYDCVILDIMMPKVDGYGVLSEMRRRHARAVCQAQQKGRPPDGRQRLRCRKRRRLRAVL